MRNFVRLLAVRLGVVAVVLGLAVADAVAQDGIFADFTTSQGNFTCQLDYTHAPKAVANFIGLATGARAWVDTPTGLVRTNAFYNGLTFHRVISGFMIQGGSPNGQGTDGPGYAFQDEFTPALRFDGPGVLAMANSGTNSNGAQFFVTVSIQFSLNDHYAIFGHVTSGQDVVNAISVVATDTNDKPLTPVVVQSVAIRRVGAAAQAFDIGAQNLPVVSSVPLGISTGGGQSSLTFANGLYAENFFASSANLTNWTGTSLGVDLTLPATNQVQRAMSGAAQFYALSRVQYPSSTFAPRTVKNRTLTMTFSNGTGTVTIGFDAGTNSTYQFNIGSYAVSDYAWTQGIYTARLWPSVYKDSGDSLYWMMSRFNFTSDSGGSFSGTVYPSYPYSTGAFNVSGTFTLTAP